MMTVVSSLKTVRDYLDYFVQEAEKRGLYFGHGTLVDYVNLVFHRPMNAEEEAIEIVSTVLDKPTDFFEYYEEDEISPEEAEKIMDMFQQRLEARKPLPYILGSTVLAEDYGFTLTQDVAISRSPIAEIIQDDLFPWKRDRDKIKSVLDLCTGSGALAVFAAQCCYLAKVHAIDIAPKAVALAKEQCESYALGDMVKVYQGDLFAPLKANQKFDLILANPPYVPSEEMAALPPEFHHEPAQALDAGPGGLDFVDRILKGAIAHLKEKGIILFDIGFPENRPRIEAAYPNLTLKWIKTSRGNDLVFAVKAETLQQYFNNASL